MYEKPLNQHYAFKPLTGRVYYVVCKKNMCFAIYWNEMTEKQLFYYLILGLQRLVNIIDYCVILGMLILC